MGDERMPEKVPTEWAGFEFEYRNGYENGLKRNRRWCPVSSSVEAGVPRKAWKAGYQDGKREAQCQGLPREAPDARS